MSTVELTRSYETMSCEELRELVRKLQDQNVELEKEREIMKSSCSALEKENASQKVQIASLEEQLALEKIRFEQQKQDMTNISRLLSEARESNGLLEAKLAEREAIIRKLSEQVTKLRNEKFGSSTEQMAYFRRTGTVEDSATEFVEPDPVPEEVNTEDSTDHPAETTGSDTVILTDEDGETVIFTEKEEDGNQDDSGSKQSQEGTPGTDPGAEGMNGQDTQASTGKPEKKDGRRRPNTGAKSKTVWKKMEDLPNRDEYHLSAETVREYDEKYGEGNWRIVYWEKSSHVNVIPRVYYVQNDFTPVIEYTEEPGVKSLMRPTDICPYFYPHSIWSPSLFATIVCDKFGLSLPLYRQSDEILRVCGLEIFRSGMARTLIRAANGFAGVVFSHMVDLCSRLEYSQCDETYVQVLEGGRSRTRSYFWVHVSGELRKEDPRIAVFCFEQSRNAEHLRKFFSSDFIGVMTSDGYVCYPLIEGEIEGLTCSGCHMHIRRGFVSSYNVLLSAADFNDAVLVNTVEFKIILLYSKLYEIEARMKDKSADERLAERQAHSKPLVDQLYDLVKSVDIKSPEITESLRKAVTYALNQETRARMFLEDGNIPIDNGYTERTLRPLCVGRRNWLFCDTLAGGRACGIFYSLVVTAQLNDADPNTYIQYLCEKVPGGIDGTKEPLSAEFLDSLMPWSPEYKAYEERKRREVYEQVRLVSDEKPDIRDLRDE